MLLQKIFNNFQSFEDKPDEWEVWAERFVQDLSNATYSLLRDLCMPS